MLAQNNHHRLGCGERALACPHNILFQGVSLLEHLAAHGSTRVEVVLLDALRPCLKHVCLLHHANWLDTAQVPMAFILYSCSIRTRFDIIIFILSYILAGHYFLAQSLQLPCPALLNSTAVCGVLRRLFDTSCWLTLQLHRPPRVSLSLPRALSAAAAQQPAHCLGYCLRLTNCAQEQTPTLGR